MIRLRGGVWLPPADLGFDALALGAGLFADRVTPWAALGPIYAVNFYLRNTGPSTSLRMDWGLVDPADGNTLIGTANAFVISSGINIAAGAATSAIRFEGSISGASSAVSTGGTLTAAGPLILGAPYISLRITNADGVNAATVTLRVWLSMQGNVPGE